MVVGGPITRGRSSTYCGSAGSRRLWTGTSSTFRQYYFAARPRPSIATGVWYWNTSTRNGAASGPSTCRDLADTRRPPDADATRLLLRGRRGGDHAAPHTSGPPPRQAHHRSPEYRRWSLRRRG